MEPVIPIYKNGSPKNSRTSTTPVSDSVSIVLNCVLSIVLCLFLFCTFRFVQTKQHTSVMITDSSSSRPNRTTNYTPIPRKTSYYDFQAYQNQTNSSTNLTKNRRFFYVNLGCFDGRDTEQFIHFHFDEILKTGKLHVIAFEPDPINFSACQASQRKYPHIPATVHDAAAWTTNGKVSYVTEKGQRSRIDFSSIISVRSVDFSLWLYENLRVEDDVYIKFTISGAEIPILEKMVFDESLKLVDHLEIEWNDVLSRDFEPRRVVLECMFDNFGMDYLYMIDPADLRHAHLSNDTFEQVPKEKQWRLNDTLVRFYYKTRKEVPDLMVERSKRKQQF